MKRFERSNGLDTALYKTIPLPFFLCIQPVVGSASVNIYKNILVTCEYVLIANSQLALRTAKSNNVVKTVWYLSLTPF